MIRRIVRHVFSNPTLLNIARNILENDFIVPQRIVSKELDKNKKTMDIGCGTGEHSVMFNPENYFGVDISKEYIANAKKRFKGNFFVMDGQDIKFPDKSFDNVLILGILHHLDDKTAENILKEAKRLAKGNASTLVMEDIPAKSRLNFIGSLAHYLDPRTNLRKTEGYKALISKHFKIKKQFETRSGVCDYCVFVLQK